MRGGLSVLARKTTPDINGVIHKYGSTFLIIIYMAIIILGTFYDNEYFSVALWYIPSALMIYLLATKERRLTILFENRFLVFIGNISFELFLVHQLVIRYYSVLYKKFLGSDIASWSYIIPLCISVLLAEIINRKARV